jgi:glyoxylase-like metal-dependent hydrolase (beta-lactamase superfamily II)
MQDLAARKIGQRRQPATGGDDPWELADDVHCLGPSGRTQTNIFFVQSHGSWVLIDAGWENDLARIERAAATLCGAGKRPVAILLTHCHPDHAGSALELAKRWGCEVYMHPSELPIATGDFAAMVEQAGPLDRFLILPIMRALGRRRREAAIAKSSLRGVATGLDPDRAPPALPDWRTIPTPGHTPGHVSYFRPEDRVLISGDSLVTLELNSPLGFVLRRQGFSAPPWYTTWDRRVAEHSISVLAALGPGVVAGGHGWPVAGPDVDARLRAFARAAGRGRRMAGEVFIARPVEEVFDMAADEPSWNPAMTSVEWLTPPPMGTGTRFVATMGRMKMEVEITEFDRPHLIGSHTRSPMMTTDGVLSLTPAADGTLLRWDWIYRLNGVTRLVAPLFAAIGGRWERANWVRMRDLLMARPRQVRLAPSQPAAT